MNKLLAAVAVAGLLGLASTAHAYQVTVRTANTGGTAFDAVPGGITSGITASFTYTGPISFVNNAAQNGSSTGDLNSTFFSVGSISGYSGSGSLGAPANANFSSLSSFLGSSGSASNFQYGSLYSFDLGVLAAGTQLVITHDDGASVYQNGTRIGTTTAGATSAVTETVILSTTADTVLWYARENGTPSVLTVGVPEPASMAVLGAGLALTGLIRRRAKRA